MTVNPQDKIARLQNSDFVEARYLGRVGTHFVLSPTRVLWQFGIQNYGRFTRGNVFLVHVKDVESRPDLFEPITVVLENQPSGKELVTEEKDTTEPITSEKTGVVASPSIPDFSAMTYKQLQQELKAIGLSGAGTKEELIERLTEAYGESN